MIHWNESFGLGLRAHRATSRRGMAAFVRRLVQPMCVRSKIEPR